MDGAPRCSLIACRISMSISMGSRSSQLGGAPPSAPRTCEVARYAGIDMPGRRADARALATGKVCWAHTLRDFDAADFAVSGPPQEGPWRERWSRCFQTIVRAVRRNGSVGEPIWLPCEIGDINHNAASSALSVGPWHRFGSHDADHYFWRAARAHPDSARAHEEGIARRFFLRDGLVLWDKARSCRWGSCGAADHRRLAKDMLQKRPLGFGSMACEFDGKLSVVLEGQLLLYARANMDRETGGRHVQVARSADGRTWAAFELIRFEGGAGRENNIYYLNAQAINGNLVATFPAYLDGSPGVWPPHRTTAYFGRAQRGCSPRLRLVAHRRPPRGFRATGPQLCGGAQACARCGLLCDARRPRHRRGDAQRRAHQRRRSSADTTLIVACRRGAHVQCLAHQGDDRCCCCCRRTSRERAVPLGEDQERVAII